MNISKEKFVDIFGIKKEIPSYFINNMEISVLCEFLINNEIIINNKGRIALLTSKEEADTQSLNIQ